MCKHYLFLFTMYTSTKTNEYEKVIFRNEKLKYLSSSFFLSIIQTFI